MAPVKYDAIAVNEISGPFKMKSNDENSGDAIILEDGSSAKRELRFQTYDGSATRIRTGNTSTDLRIGTRDEQNLMTLDNNGKVLIGDPTSSGDAILEVTGTTGGFLPPRMTTAQMLAISSPVSGLMVYNSTSGLLQVHSGGNWLTISTS